MNGKKITALSLSAAMIMACMPANTAMAGESENSFVKEFQNPSNEYRPRVRWWWPGGDVTSEELIRELNLLKEAGFGGAEMQPFDYSLDPKDLKNSDSKIKDFMTDSFMEKVSALLAQAQELQMIMDINIGSGYCAGASFVPIEDNEMTLMSADITVNGDQKAAAIPMLPEITVPYDMFDPENENSPRGGWKVMNYMPEKAELLKLYAAKITDGERNPDYTVLNDTVTLDLESVEMITDIDTEAGTFNWTCPDTSGNWQIIAVYSMPVGSNPIGSVEVGAEGEESYMVDALNYAACINFYKNWLALLEPIMQYTEDGTLRAAFNDSYEFFAQRTYTDGILETFKEINQYDISEYLPTLLMPARDQVANFFLPDRAAEYAFEDVDGDGINERINYDYDRAVGESILNGWLQASADTFAENPLLFRQQSYNPPMDRIRAASYADIPEAENNTVNTNKVIASGAHIYDKNTLSAETFVFFTDEDGAGNFKITPEVYRQQADLMITSGVNEMFYHGFPYVYNTEDNKYGVQNWSAFCSSYSMYDIPTTFSEADSFWPYVKDLNDYVGRLQFLMKQGKASMDVLVFLPFKASETAEEISSVTAMLDNDGITWDFISDDILKEAEYTEEGIVVEGHVYDALVLPNVSCIESASMEALNILSEAGAPVAVYGNIPSRQPGYADGDYQEADQRVAELGEVIIQKENSPLISSEEELDSFMEKYAKPEISYEENSKLMCARRDYTEEGMGHLMFVRNTDSQETDYTLNLPEDTSVCYVLDARTGAIYQEEVQNSIFKGTLGGNQSLAVLAAEKEIFDSSMLTEKTPSQISAAELTLPVDPWTLVVDGQDVSGYQAEGEAALGLWRDNETLKYCADSGNYTAKVSIDSIEEKQYILRLNGVNGVPEISVNGSENIPVSLAPYELDITSMLTEGENEISVNLVVPLRNRLVGYAENGEDGNGKNVEAYAQFAGKTLAKSGMTGTAEVLVFAK